MKKQNTPRYRLMPSTIILAASQGEPEAIAAVLNHYSSYIAKLSMRRFHDDYGNIYYCVDETLRGRLEIKLIAGILSFTVV